MRTASLLFIFCIHILYVQGKKSENEDEEHSELGRGFGDDIKWVPWNGAISTAKLLNKPIFLLIHKTWCGACKALKSEFQNSNNREELVKLSKNFVMVNTEDDEEPDDEKYAPDGGYIPRLFFLDPNGDILEGTENSNYPNNKHYFPRLPNIIEKMKHALKLVKSSSSIEIDNEKMDKKEVKKENEKQKNVKIDGSDDNGKKKDGKNDGKTKNDKSQGVQKSRDEKKRKNEL